MKKRLFIRVDRLGDLVLTLPTTAQAHNESSRVHWWVPEGLGFVLHASKENLTYKEVPRQLSWKNFWRLFKDLRREQYHEALIFHAPSWIYFLLFLARVPLRAGRLSQWYSFLTLNRGLRQKRSLSEKNELEYNLELTNKTLGLPVPSSKGIKLSPPKPNDSLNRFQLHPKDYVVIHPGMGGSALNWPTSHYQTLIKELSKNVNVVITGTPGDQPYTAPLEALKEHPKVYWLVSQLSPDDLLNILYNAKTVIAPSTGVVHLAASLGVQTLGLYSPVRSHSARRWGPVGERVTTYQPKVQCPASLDCMGATCPHYFCMELISPEEILKHPFLSTT